MNQKIIREEVELNNHTERTVINPCVSDYVACMGQIDEFNKIRNQFKQQRCIEGASIKQAEKVAAEITDEVVEKAKALKSEKLAKKHRVLEAIEEKLPDTSEEKQAIRAAMLTKYLDEHGAELQQMAEQYTLAELQAETDFAGTVANKTPGFRKTLLKCLDESEQTSKELDMYAAQGIGKVMIY